MFEITQLSPSACFNHTVRTNFFRNFRESNIFFSPYRLKDSKKTVIIVYEFPQWELSFILFFVSLHRVTQISTLLPTLEAWRQKQ